MVFTCILLRLSRRTYKDNYFLCLSVFLSASGSHTLVVVILFVAPTKHSGTWDHFVRPPSVRPSVCHTFLFADNFFTLRGRTFIFGKCVPYDKTSLMVPLILIT